ncbi:MAG: nickel pincer cofactor biosynthesis protein LarB [Acidobacteria bacterium]|nr:MAG: nickel pincer cofactor biosynthesis protein LarB [Acidobacteriota bacterium]
MMPDHLKKALREFKEGRIGEEQILDLLRDLPYENLDFAKVDHHRTLRHGFPEVIFGKGKTPEQIEAIAAALLLKNPNLLVTRASVEAHARLKERFPDCHYYPNCGALTVLRESRDHGRGKIGIFSAGTADIPVAEEAQVTAQAMGNETHCCYDVGVAGLHRILSQLDTLRSCTVVVVVAGMEGALPSVVGGLVDLPVIAVPTSIGYGASFNGIAALLGMLNSCSSNVSVVNIDNGFGAGYIASLINRKADN